MGVNSSIEGSNPSFSAPASRAVGGRAATLSVARRGGRAVECGGLENRYGSLGSSRVQIPPSPLYKPNPAWLSGIRYCSEVPRTSSDYTSDTRWNPLDGGIDCRATVAHGRPLEVGVDQRNVMVTRLCPR